MIKEDRWARIINAAARPHLITSLEQRQSLLKIALGLGESISSDCVGCSVTITTDSGYETPAASTELAMALDLAQYSASDGPCVAACRDGEPHSIVIMSQEEDFPGFTGAAVSRNVRSSLSLPLSTRPVAALNLYARGTNAFTDPHPQATAALLARCVAHFVPARSPTPGRVVPQAPRSAERRRSVLRARHHLAEREGLTDAAAFDRLALESRVQGLSIFEVCDAVLDSGADGGRR